ncbi:MAG: hypothetical protein V7L11_19165 [Nostoc sp.]|uniref:hypothetical protein n=1 Tax=Nostoc sp. TaxID=1180 RepID=UPI002FF857A1
MTIPLFCGDARRGLVIRSRSVPQGRGTDSYGEEGRRQDSVAVAIRLPPAFVDKINHPVPNGTKKSYKLCSNWFPTWRLGTHYRGAAASSGLTRGSSPSEYIPSLKTGNEVTQAFRLFLVPFHPVPLISENLQPALDEVFHGRS